jgi:FkbM family methyltransferase
VLKWKSSLNKFTPNYPISVILKGVLRDPKILWRILTSQPISTIDINLIMDLLPSDPIIIEAGAADGSDSEKFLEIKEGAKLYCFEPNPNLFEKLYEKLENRARCFGIALGPPGVDFVDLWVTPNADSSSILAPTEHINYFPKVRFSAQPIKVESVTLDEIVNRHKISKVDLLWLDLQGAEIEILESGAIKTLEITSAVHIEVCRVPMYQGACTLREVIIFMELKGFKLKHLRAPFVFGNALFIKTANKY